KDENAVSKVLRAKTTIKEPLGTCKKCDNYHPRKSRVSRILLPSHTLLTLEQSNGYSRDTADKSTPPNQNGSFIFPSNSVTIENKTASTICKTRPHWLKFEILVTHLRNSQYFPDLLRSIHPPTAIVKIGEKYASRPI
ncbi:hypothetical protein, partial [Bartonella sp. CL42QHWL]|uniref:hypothetical protein n=1 Tax=Bartonella sp. CL42QHWL TaxID=3243528 RepID=UPI0035CEC40B